MNRLTAARQGHFQEDGLQGHQFPQAREYAIMQHFAPSIARLERLIRGDVRSLHGPTLHGNAPDEATIRRFREAQSNLARQALEAIRSR